MVHRRFSAVLLLLISLFMVVLSARAHEAADIYIEGIWAMPCQEDSAVSVFMTVDNTAVAHPIALIGASSPAAEHVRLVEDESGCAEGMTERIVIPFGERVDFSEANYAIAVELSEPHELGEAFSLTLTFDMLNDALESEGTTVDVVIGVPVLEEAPAPSPILVVTPWVRPTSAKAADGMSGHGAHSQSSAERPLFPAAVYMRLLNRGETADRLIAAFSPAADITEIHETTVENDVMRMNAIAGLDLPVGEWLMLEPGGYHIMLIDLKQELIEGDAIPLTLTFESGAEMTIAVPVYDALGGMGMMEGGHGDHGHMHGG